MIKTALNWGKVVYIWLMVSAVVFGFGVKQVRATQYQQCVTNSTCTVGEFLYDDNYAPIAVGTSCSLTSRYPNGDVLVNAQNMVGTADGWFAYSINTTGLSNGTYRGQMCCVTGTDSICLDKTFEVATAISSIVTDVWTTPNRALTSFGTLVTSIWTNSTRKLSSNNLDDGTSLATTDGLAVISAQVSEVQTDIETIDTKVTALQTSIGTILTNTNNILAKWSTYSVTDILNYVDSVETQLGNNTQTCTNNSVFGHVQCLIDKWGTDSASSIYTAANNAYTTANSLRSELNFNGKSTTAYDEIIALKAYVDSIESSIGSTSDTSDASSIFGRMKQIKEAVDAIDSTSVDLTELLAKWGSYDATAIYDKVKNLSSDIANINTISNVTQILNTTTNVNNITEIKNQVLAMRALLDVNRIQLERLDNKPIIKSWLENGSIIFKSLITNPSKSTIQDVPFTYYLPPEVKEADIIKKSDSLTIKYDTSRSLLYASADFELAPKETIIVEIEVKDIWSVPTEKIESLRRQATELFNPLKKTSYFAQGATLYADIQASLDRIVEIQKPSKLPEEKIKDYRDAQIELESVNKKMDSLKEIVSSAGSIGTLSGFIGGVQTVGSWGIIVVLVAGFVLLALYIKTTSTKNKVKTKVDLASPYKPNKKNNTNILVVLLVFGLSSISTGALVSYYFASKTDQDTTLRPAVLSAKDTISHIDTPTTVPTMAPTTPTMIPAKEEVIPVDTVTPSEAPTPTKALAPTASATKRAVIVPSLNSYVNVRQETNRNSTLVTKVLSGSEVSVLSEKFNDLGEKWVKISQNENQGWVLGELIQYVQGSSVTTQTAQTAVTTPSAKITINVPSHDIVYIYSKPSFNASITHKLSESQQADILLETKMWAKVILSKINVEGWVSQDFVSKNIQ